MVIISRFAFPSASKRAAEIRADFQKNPSMLTLGSFAFACITIVGCVLWACAKDGDQT